MLFLFCFGIYWPDFANDLAPKINMTFLQFNLATALDVFKSDSDKFIREFKTQLTWEEIEEFRRVMEPLLLDIVKGTQNATEVLSNKHPLLPYYEKALDYRSRIN